MHPRPSMFAPGPLLVAVAGPAAVGAALGIPLGAREMAHDLVALPLVIAGVTLVMAPALYVATTLSGAAPSATQFAEACGRGLRACGIVLLGLAPPLLFLLSTSAAAPDLVTALGVMAVAAGTCAALRVVGTAVVGEGGRRFRSMGLFAVWALISLAIGLRLFLDHIA
jgi:hypothetical protein